MRCSAPLSMILGHPNAPKSGTECALQNAGAFHLKFSYPWKFVKSVSQPEDGWDSRPYLLRGLRELRGLFTPFGQVLLFVAKP